MVLTIYINIWLDATISLYHKVMLNNGSFNFPVIYCGGVFHAVAVVAVWHASLQDGRTWSNLAGRPRKDKSRVGMINDKLIYTVTNGVRYFSRHLLLSPCEITYSIK